jgi:hypothetical protein
MSARLLRGDRTYARSRTRPATRGGRLELRAVRRIAAGRYTLRVVVIDGKGRRTVIRRPVTIR